MIERLQLLRNVGQFDSVDAGATIPLFRHVLIYAENGRGKTTLAAVLRSLATGDPIPISERRRLGAVAPPHVVLLCSGDIQPAIFMNGRWSRTHPEIVIFDDRFVNENVYSGLTVEPTHRQNLHELVLGAPGVALNRQLQELVRRVEEHNLEIRERAAAIGPRIRGARSVDQFCELANLEDIGEAITLAERNLAAAREQQAVCDTPSFDPLELPIFNLGAIRAVLMRDLPALDTAAVTHVREHFGQIGRDGEAWVAEGMGRIVRLADRNEACPFCAQGLAQSEIINHYRAYFGREYRLLKEDIARALTETNRVHSRDIPTRFERAVRVAGERRQFWSNFCDVPEIQLNTEAVNLAWQTTRDAVVAMLEAKQAAPLERIELPEMIEAAVATYDTQREIVDRLNTDLQEVGHNIAVVKERAAGANFQVLVADLERLRAIQTRNSTDVAALCEQYASATSEKVGTVEERERVKVALEEHRRNAFPGYETAINTQLGRFNAGFRISHVTAVDTRGGPTCNYEIVINTISIPIAGGNEVEGQPAFRNILSSGDRNTLALAIFFATMDQDLDIANKVVVIDDPISSLDEHRALATVQELRRLGRRTSQLVILSHDKSLLCRMWQRLDQAECTTIKIDRDAVGSTLSIWDAGDDALTDHDRRHAALRNYVINGVGDNNREIASSIRPLLEGFLRVAYPENFRPGPRILGTFVGTCRQNLGTNTEILNPADTQELGELTEYANLFHHETNEAYQNVVINDGELTGFAQRALRFAKR